MARRRSLSSRFSVRRKDFVWAHGRLPFQSFQTAVDNENPQIIIPAVLSIDWSAVAGSNSRDHATVMRVLGQVTIRPVNTSGEQTPGTVNLRSTFAWQIGDETAGIPDLEDASVYGPRDIFGMELRSWADFRSSGGGDAPLAYHVPAQVISWDLSIRRRISSDDEVTLFGLVNAEPNQTNDVVAEVSAWTKVLIKVDS